MTAHACACETQPQHQHTARDVAKRHHPLRGEHAVDELPNQERREDRPHGQSRPEDADLVSAEAQRVLNVNRGDRQISPLHEVLQEHHHRKPPEQLGRRSDIDRYGAVLHSHPLGFRVHCTAFKFCRKRPFATILLSGKIGSNGDRRDRNASTAGSFPIPRTTDIMHTPPVTYDFVAPGRIAFGWGRRRQLGALARSLGRRATIVCGSRTLRRRTARSTKSPASSSPKRSKSSPSR